MRHEYWTPPRLPAHFLSLPHGAVLVCARAHGDDADGGKGARTRSLWPRLKGIVTGASPDFVSTFIFASTGRVPPPLFRGGFIVVRAATPVLLSILRFVHALHLQLCLQFLETEGERKTKKASERWRQKDDGIFGSYCRKYNVTQRDCGTWRQNDDARKALSRATLKRTHAWWNGQE
jgi:hypothetical protein